MNRFLPLLILLAACFGQGNYLPEPAPIGTPGAKIAQGFIELSAGQWRGSPFIRPWDDIALELQPVRVVSAGDGTYCPVPSTSPWWAVAKRGDNIPCPAGWRMARP